MSASTPVAPQGPNLLLPFAAALGLSALAFFGIVNAMALLGYGSDIHALRALALSAPVFVAGVIAFWPGRSMPIRAATLCVGLTAGWIAWMFVPCRSGGMSLADAVAKRNGLKSLAKPSYDDIGKAEQVAATLAFATDFPSLAENNPAVNEWPSTAAERVAERYRTVAPDDVAGVDDVVKSAQLLTKHLPQTRESIAAAEREFSNRSADFWADELKQVSSNDFNGFVSWVGRREKGGGVKPNSDRINTAEEAWVAASIDEAISWDEHIRQFQFLSRRESVTLLGIQLKDSRLPTLVAAPRRQEMLRAMMSLRLAVRDSGPENVPFRASRQKLFDAALARAQNEARVHLEAGACDLAFGRARTHAVDWSPEAATLGPAAQRALADFREGYRYLDALAAKAGDAPNAAPVPRTKP